MLFDKDDRSKLCPYDHNYTLENRDVAWVYILPGAIPRRFDIINPRLDYDGEFTIPEYDYFLVDGLKPDDDTKNEYSGIIYDLVRHDADYPGTDQ